jgi:hypothetical protein
MTVTVSPLSVAVTMDSSSEEGGLIETHDGAVTPACSTRPAAKWDRRRAPRDAVRGIWQSPKIMLNDLRAYPKVSLGLLGSVAAISLANEHFHWSENLDGAFMGLGGISAAVFLSLGLKRMARAYDHHDGERFSQGAQTLGMALSSGALMAVTVLALEMVDVSQYTTTSKSLASVLHLPDEIVGGMQFFLGLRAWHKKSAA